MAESSESGARIDTSNFPDALQSIQNMAKAMEGITLNLDYYKADLISNWVGDGRNQFEKTYNIMVRKLKDGTDVTWDMYEKLVSFQETLIQSDVDTAKGISSGSGCW